MRSLLVLIAALPALAACDRFAPQPAQVPDGNAQEMVRRADPVILAERRAAGRWRSEAGILPGDSSLWVIIDISGSKDLRIERRGLSGRFESVYAQASGKVEITGEGVTAEAPDADGSLHPFRSFSASFPSPSKMLVKSGDQTFLFTYVGA